MHGVFSSLNTHELNSFSGLPSTKDRKESHTLPALPPSSILKGKECEKDHKSG